MESTNNSDFNKAMQDILVSAIGRNIQVELDAGKIDNLPPNFELVDDFQPDAYKVKCQNSEH